MQCGLFHEPDLRGGAIPMAPLRTCAKAVRVH